MPIAQPSIVRSRSGSLSRAALAAFVSAAALLVGGACTTYDTYPGYGSRYGYGYGSKKKKEPGYYEEE